MKRTTPRIVFVSAVMLALACPAGATVWNVSTVGELDYAFQNLQAGDEVIIAAGTYNLSAYYLYINVSDVIVRGATGNADDVILQGPGMNVNQASTEALNVNADDATIMDLTIKEFYHHGIHIRGENDVDRTLVHNVKTINCGERHIKGSSDTSSTTKICDDTVLEFVVMEQTKTLTSHTDNNYIGGIDCMGMKNFTIRDCVGINIQGATGGGRGMMMIYMGIDGVTVERCKAYGCDRGICLGNPSGTGHAYMAPWCVVGGIVRNNFVTRGINIALEICDTKDLNVYYNSIYSEDASYFRTVHIWGPNTTNLHLAYNIIRGQIYENSTGDWTYTGNITGSTPQADWFTDWTVADLHLTENATAAIDAASPLPEVTEDYDQQPRGTAPDVGGDESNPPEGVTVSFDLASSNGAESVTPVNLSVSLSEAADEVVTVDYAVTGGTAQGGGVDYTLNPDTLTFQVGQTTKNIPITIVDDGDPEDDETIEVTLSNPVNAMLGSIAVHTYTIIDNDSPVSLFADDFESGNFSAGGWTASGAASVSRQAEYEGTYGAKLGGIASITKALSTSGYADVHVKCYWKAQGLDSGEYLYCEWSDNGGQNWYELGKTQASSWGQADFTCPSGAANNPNFEFRFRTNANKSNEYGCVDNVEIIGTPQ